MSRTQRNKTAFAAILALMTTIIIYIIYDYVNHLRTVSVLQQKTNIWKQGLLPVDLNGDSLAHISAPLNKVGNGLVSKSENWTLRLVDIPYRAYIVQDHGHLLKRITNYNQAIQELRNKIWSAREHSDWRDISKSINVVWGSNDDFFVQLSNFTHLKTVMLPWKASTEHDSHTTKWSSLEDKENLLLQEYYPWTATNPLCHWIETRGFTKAKWDGVYNKTCTLDFDSSNKVISLEMVYLHGKPINPKHYWPNNGDTYPEYFFTSLPPHVYFLHLAEDTVITANGDIFSRDLKLVQYTCSHDINPNPPPDYTNTPIYRDVFIMTQFWCIHFFHKMLECLPRIAPYLQLLQSNKDILIHVSETSGSTAELLGYLGINNERLVTGVCRAKVVYMPQGTPCGFPVPTESQILSLHLREAFIREYPNRYLNMTRNNLVLIRRSGTRRFSHQELIERLMKNVAKDYHLTYRLFPDNPVPPQEKAMEYFNGAKTQLYCIRTSQ